MLILAATLAYALYWGIRKKDFSLQERKILAALRFVSYGIILFLLLKPLLFLNKAEEILPKLFIAIDASASMVSGKDSAWVQSQLKPKLIDAQGELSDKYDIKWLHFAGDVKAELPADYTQGETDISAAMRTVQAWNNPEEVAGLLLITDGIYNRGIDPVYLANSLPFPVHTLAVGDSTRYPNLNLSEVFHNAFVYPDTEFEVEILVDAYQAQGNTAELQILQNERVLKSEKIAFKGSNQTWSKRYMLPAGKAGLKKFTAKISTLNNEKNTRDNSFDFFVEVIDNQKKVLLIQENIHPDMGVIRNFLIQSKNYKLFEISASKLKDFKEKVDIIITHSPQSDEIANYYKNHKQTAVWLIAGFGTQRNVANTLLDLDLGNTTAKPNKAQWLNQPTFAGFRLNPALNQVFTSNQGFDIYFNPQNIESTWSPVAMQKINNIELDRGLLFVQNNQPRRALLNGEGLYRWHLQSRLRFGRQDPVLDGIAQLLQYLSSDQKRKNLEVRNKKEFFENEEVLLDARLYDPSYVPLANQLITLELSKENGKQTKYNFSPAGESYQLKINDLSEGIYTYKAQAQVGNETYTDQGLFKVSTLGREKINTLAQHAMLSEISAQTQGFYQPIDKFDQMIKDLKNSASEKSYVKFERKLMDLVELKGLFILILLILSGEWALRRYFGNY